MEVYCISLKKNKNKWYDLIEYISDNGFEKPQIFEAIDGKILKEIYETNDISKYPYMEHMFSKLGITHKQLLSLWTRFNLEKNINRKFHSQIPTWGGVGCYLSHVYIWIMMIEKGVDQFCVFEDDIKFNKNFKRKYESIMLDPPKDADIIFLDVAWSENSITYDNNFDKIIGSFFGTHAYIMKTKSAIKFITDIFPIEIQIDAYLSYFSQLNKMNLYYAKKLCEQQLHISSIQKPCVLCDINSNEVSGFTKFFIIFIIFCVILIIILTVSIIWIYTRNKNLKNKN